MAATRRGGIAMLLRKGWEAFVSSCCEYVSQILSSVSLKRLVADVFFENATNCAISDIMRRRKIFFSVSSVQMVRWLKRGEERGGQRGKSREITIDDSDGLGSSKRDETLKTYKKAHNIYGYKSACT